MSDQTDPLTTVLADAIDAQNDGGGENFYINREAMTAEIECYRMDIAALAKAIRAAYPTEYGVQITRPDGETRSVRLEGQPREAAEAMAQMQSGQVVTWTVIPGTPIKESE